MALPWQKNKEGGAVGPVDRKVREHDEDHDFDTMHAAAFDLKEALKNDDVQAIAAALRAAFQIMDSEPHEEGEHTDG